MYRKNQTSKIQKTSYTIMLLAVFLSAFGGRNFHSVHAQAAIREVNVAQTTGNHQITYFQDNKAGAVSFTFDDGFLSHLAIAIPQLDARGLKGTFFVITNRQDTSSWAAWQSVVAEGHEVASHTVSHRDLFTLSQVEILSELADSQVAISQNVPGQSCASVAYPFTNTDTAIQAVAAQYYDAARAGSTPTRILNHYQSGSDQYGSWSAIDFSKTVSINGDALGLANQYLSDQYFNNALDAAVSRHAWFSLHIHDIVDGVAFGNILDHVQGKHDYWIDTYCNISRYMKERLNSTVQLVSETPYQINLNIVMDASLPIETYNFPLTMRSVIPVSWGQQVKVQQESSIQILTSVMEGNERVVYYKALPNGGNIFLAPANPGAFDKSSPTNGAIIHQTTSINLAWSASTGATLYEYCYDTTNNNTCSTWVNNGTATSKNLNLTPGFTYYWHVRGVNNGGTTYSNNDDSSAFSSFTLACYNLNKSAAPGAGGVINTSPAPNCNNGTQYTYGTVVTVTAATNTLYAFSNWGGDVSGSFNSANVTMTANKSVNVNFAAFNTNLSSPVLRSPQSNLLILNNKPTFSWSSVISGQNYEIVFATDSAFANIVDSKKFSQLLYTPTSPFSDGKYYWRVRAYNASNQFGKWSLPRAFTIDTIGPLTPVLSSPADNASTRTPTFKWLNVPTATAYEFQYDNESNFSSPTYVVTVRGTSRKPPAMKVGVYYWRVRAQDSVGNWGAWSTHYKITITGP